MPLASAREALHKPDDAQDFLFFRFFDKLTYQSAVVAGMAILESGPEPRLRMACKQPTLFPK